MISPLRVLVNILVSSNYKYMIRIQFTTTDVLLVKHKLVITD